MADATDVHILDAAAVDVEAAVDWYLEEAGPDVAARFLVDVEDVIQQLRRFPDTGSRSWATMLRFEGLRSTPLADFPYVAFHVRRNRRVEILRVLHERRDLPAQIGDPSQ